MSRHYVITISRQFGTGGREIGKALGAALEVPVYDRELLEILHPRERDGAQ